MWTARQLPTKRSLVDECHAFMSCRNLICGRASRSVLILSPLAPDDFLLSYVYQTPGTRRYRTRDAYSLYPASSFCSRRSSKIILTMITRSPPATGTKAQ